MHITVLVIVNKSMLLATETHHVMNQQKCILYMWPVEQFRNMM